MADHDAARRTRISWEPVVDLRSGDLVAHRARITAPEGVDGGAAAAQALLAAATVSALPLRGRLLILPMTVADAASAAVAAVLGHTAGAASRVVVELVADDAASGHGEVARTLRLAGLRVALAADVASGLADWDAVDRARRTGADLGCGPVIGRASSTFRPPARDVVARLRRAVPAAGFPAAAAA